MRYHKYLALACLSSAVCAKPLPADTTISVFTTQHYPIQQSELANHVYFLDAVENLEEDATKFLNEHLDIAEKQAKQWLGAQEGKVFEQQLKLAYEGVITGWKQGIMKIPAVLFERQGKDPVVIYGQTHVGKAIETYQKFQE